VSEKFALLSDGYGSLMILDTGDRQRSDEWKRVGPPLQPLGDTGFIVQDAKLTFDNGDKIIHCLLLHIEQIEGKFFNVIEWLTLKLNESSKTWEDTARRTIQGKGSLFYLSLDPKCDSIVYSSNQEYKFTLDTVNEITVEEEPPEKAENPVEESENNFKWKQNGEDIAINFKKIENVSKDQFKVTCHQSHIEVKVAEEVLINSDLFAEIDTDLTTWTIEEESLQLNLVKRDPTLIWPYLIPGGPPMEVEGAGDVLTSAPVADMNSQMEECDFAGDDEDEFFIGE
jgi:hypothetical protein